MRAAYAHESCFRNSEAEGFTVTPDAHKMLQSRILALSQLAKSHTERFYSRNIVRLDCYRKIFLSEIACPLKISNKYALRAAGKYFIIKYINWNLEQKIYRLETENYFLEIEPEVHQNDLLFPVNTSLNGKVFSYKTFCGIRDGYW